MLQCWLACTGWKWRIWQCCTCFEDVALWQQAFRSMKAMIYTAPAALCKEKKKIVLRSAIVSKTASTGNCCAFPGRNCTYKEVNSHRPMKKRCEHALDERSHYWCASGPQPYASEPSLALLNLGDLPKGWAISNLSEMPLGHHSPSQTW